MGGPPMKWMIAVTKEIGLFWRITEHFANIVGRASSNNLYELNTI